MTVSPAQSVISGNAASGVAGDVVVSVGESVGENDFFCREDRPLRDEEEMWFLAAALVLRLAEMFR